MKFLKYWLPPIVLMIIIFLLSSRQRVKVSDTYIINFIVFKIGHMLEYATLFLLFRRAFTYGSNIPHRAILISFLCTIFYAATDEFHQTFVPTREGSPRDVIIDGIGALLAWIFLIKQPPILPKKLKQLAENWQLI